MKLERERELSNMLASAREAGTTAALPRAYDAKR